MAIHKKRLKNQQDDDGNEGTETSRGPLITPGDLHHCAPGTWLVYFSVYMQRICVTRVKMVAHGSDANHGLLSKLLFGGGGPQPALFLPQTTVAS